MISLYSAWIMIYCLTLYYTVHYTTFITISSNSKHYKPSSTSMCCDVTGYWLQIADYWLPCHVKYLWCEYAGIHLVRFIECVIAVALVDQVNHAKHAACANILFVCVCVCMYVCVCVCVYIYVHTYVFVCVNVSANVRVCVLVCYVCKSE